MGVVRGMVWESVATAMVARVGGRRLQADVQFIPGDTRLSVRAIVRPGVAAVFGLASWLSAGAAPSFFATALFFAVFAGAAVCST